MTKVLMVLASLVSLSLMAAPVHAGGRSHKSGKVSARGVTLIIVLDRSGSMSGTKIAQTRQAAARMIRWLRPTDWVAVLAFDTVPRVVSALGKVGNRQAHLAAVRRLTAGGGTHFLPALQAARKMLSRAPIKHRRHVIFMSDGQSATRGVLSAVGALVRAKTALSTIALGRGADLKVLRRMARVGKGRAYATSAAGLATVCHKELKRLGR